MGVITSHRYNPQSSSPAGFQPYNAAIMSPWQGRTQSAPDVRFDTIGIATPPVEDTEQGLRRKWQTYFGDYKPYSSTPIGPAVTGNVPSASFGGYIPGRDLLRNAPNTSYNNWMPEPGSTENMLQASKVIG
uniref:Uncharacterized protein LOC100368445 n=1 Tax=Saccoglossus kowalevskii TaxID=10224 RepID=A0ABM0GXJ8_SACKO|nr:PREDICTED: uncharacterized protein LOC100368445 [Saccoglossus kowalevskii]